VALHPEVPSWPGSCGFKLVQMSDLKRGDVCNGSKLECDVHVGTHVNAPWHFLEHGTTVERMDLGRLVGPAYVAYAADAATIEAACLEGLNIPEGTKRLLLRTRNSELWAKGESKFQRDFTALSADGAEWVVKRNIELIGIDYLSIQKFHDNPKTHH